MLKTNLIQLAKNLPLSSKIAKYAEVGSSGNCNKMVERLLLKNLNQALDYLISNTQQAFIQLRQALNKAPIFWHFNLKCHIQIKTDVSGYGINRVLS